MANKQTKSRVTLDIGAGEIDETDTLGAVPLEDVAFVEYISRLDEGTKYSFKIFRDLGSNQLEDLFSFDPGSTTYDELIERIRTDFGGGIYRLQIRVSGVMRRNEQLRIGAPKVVAAAGGSMEAILPQLTKFISDMEQRITARLSLPKGDVHDPYQQMLVLATVMDRLRGKDTGADPMAMLDRVLGIAPKLKALAGGEFYTEEGDDQKWIHLIDRFAPSINAIVLKTAGIQTMDPSVVADVPVSDKQTDVIGGQAKGLNQFIVSLRPQFQMLMLPASINADVNPYANMILDQLDALRLSGKLPEGFDEVKVFSEPGLVNLISEIHPTAGKFRDWLDRLRLSVLELLKEQPEDNVTN